MRRDQRLKFVETRCVAMELRAGVGWPDAGSDACRNSRRRFFPDDPWATCKPAAAVADASTFTNSPIPSDRSTAKMTRIPSRSAPEDTIDCIPLVLCVDGLARSKERFRNPNGQRVPVPTGTARHRAKELSRRNAEPFQNCCSSTVFPRPHWGITLTRLMFYLTWPDTSLFISNMVTCALPSNTALSLASALMRVFFFSSWSLCSLM